MTETIDRPFGVLGMVMTGAAAFVLAALAFLPLALLAFGGERYVLVANSDAIQPFMLMRDLFNDPAQFIRWYHAPALSFLPDWFAAGFLVLTPLPNGVIPVVYPALVFASLSVAGGCLLAIAGLARLLPAILLAAAAVAVPLLATINLPVSAGLATLLGTGVAYWHSGALIAGLAFHALLLADMRFTARPSFRSPPLIAASLLAWLGTYSDPLLAAWFIVPGLVVVAACRVLTGALPLLARLLPILFWSVAGLLLDRLTRHFPLHVRASYADTLRTARELVAAADPVLVAALVAACAMLVRGAFLIRKTFRRRAAAPGDIAEALLIAATWAALVAPIVTGTLTEPTLLRYSQPAFLLPSLWLALLVTRFARAAVAGSIAAAVWVGALAIVASTWPQVASNVATASREDPLAACIEAAGLTEGYSDYWHAKPLMWRSDYRLHLVQLGAGARPVRFNFNRAWFAGRALTGEPLQPTFIMPTRLPRGPLSATFGTPDRTTACGGEEIWIYDRPLPLPADFGATSGTKSR